MLVCVVLMCSDESEKTGENDKYKSLKMHKVSVSFVQWVNTVSAIANGPK